MISEKIKKIKDKLDACKTALEPYVIFRNGWCRHGQGQYADIHWWCGYLKEPIAGYDQVCFMPYAISKEIVDIVLSDNPVRSSNMPDVDQKGSGDFHPSIVSVRSQCEEGKIKQIILVSKNNKSKYNGPALPQGTEGDEICIDVPKGRTPISNYYPPFMEVGNSDTALAKQGLLSTITDVLISNGVMC